MLKEMPGLGRSRGRLFRPIAIISNSSHVRAARSCTAGPVEEIAFFKPRQYDLSFSHRGKGQGRRLLQGSVVMKWCDNVLQPVRAAPYRDDPIGMRRHRRPLSTSIFARPLRRFSLADVPATCCDSLGTVCTAGMTPPAVKRRGPAGPAQPVCAQRGLASTAAEAASARYPRGPRTGLPPAPRMMCNLPPDPWGRAIRCSESRSRISNRGRGTG